MPVSFNFIVMMDTNDGHTFYETNCQYRRITRVLVWCNKKNNFEMVYMFFSESLKIVTYMHVERMVDTWMVMIPPSPMFTLCCSLIGCQRQSSLTWLLCRQTRYMSRSSRYLSRLRTSLFSSSTYKWGYFSLWMRCKCAIKSFFRGHPW